MTAMTRTYAPTSWIRALSVACLFVFGMCQSCSEPPELTQIRQHAKIRYASPTVTAPSDSRWKRAYVAVHYEPGNPRWSWAAKANHILWLNDGHTDYSVPLGDRAIKWVTLEGQWDDFFAWVDSVNYLLQFAPDGHAIIFSTDNGGQWNYVALDAGEKPVACMHLTFASAVPAGDPWPKAPTTRALMLEILASSAAEQNAPQHLDSSNQGWEEEEFEAAMRFVCAHPDDGELQKALVEAVVRPGMGFMWIWSDPDFIEFTECVGRVAGADRQARSIFIATLLAPDPKQELYGQRENAAEGLARTGDATAQEALARALLGELSQHRDDPGPCRFRGELAWALARITSSRRVASPVVVEALEAVVASPDVCRWWSAGSISRVHAIRGLAAINSAEARRFLAARAREGCEVQWPAEFRIWKEVDLAGELDAACWASAAQRSLQRPRKESSESSLRIYERTRRMKSRGSLGLTGL